MARRGLLPAAAAAALLLLAAAPPARAQGPCIPCSQCATDHCFRFCSASCPGGWSPGNIIVSGDACAAAGSAYGPTAAQQACDTAMTYCNGGVRPGARLGAIGPITLSQCSNVAMGTCQQAAAAQTPCSAQLEFGYASCGAQQFRDFYTGEVSGRCRTWAQTVTGVTPGTNNWVIGAPGPLGGAAAAPGGSAAKAAGGLGAKAPGGSGHRRMLRGAV